MEFNVQKIAFDTRIFKKKSPYRGGGHGHPHPPPARSASLPRFGPSLTNPGYTTVSGITKVQGPMPPPPHPTMIGVKEIEKGVGDWYMPLHLTYP